MYSDLAKTLPPQVTEVGFLCHKCLGSIPGMCGCGGDGGEWVTPHCLSTFDPASSTGALPMLLSAEPHKRTNLLHYGGSPLGRSIDRPEISAAHRGADRLPTTPLSALHNVKCSPYARP